MYFLRWITRHPILLIVLITLIYALTNYQNLFHWFGGKGHGEQTAQTDSGRGDAAQAPAQGVSSAAAEHARADAQATAPAKVDAAPAEVAPQAAASPPAATVQAEPAAAVGTEERPKSLFDFLRRDKAEEKAAAAPEGQAAVVAEGAKAEAAQVAVQHPADAKAADVAASQPSAASDAGKVASAVKPEEARKGEPTAAPTTAASTEASKAESAPAAASGAGEEKSTSLFDFFRKKPEATVTTEAATPAAQAGTAATPVAQPAVEHAAPAATVAGAAVATAAAVGAAATGQAEQAAAAAAETHPPKSWLDFLKRDSAPAQAQVPAQAEAAAPVQAEAAVPAQAPAPQVAVSAGAAAPQGTAPSAAGQQPGQAAVQAVAQAGVASAAPPVATVTAQAPAMQIAPAVSGEAAPSADETRKNQLLATIFDARQAFWRRDYTAAETIYRNLVTAEPNNADILGELGNMLVQSGKASEAVDFYEKAAGMLIDQDRARDAHPLVGFIAYIDRDRAQKLIERLRTAAP